MAVKTFIRGVAKSTLHASDIQTQINNILELAENELPEGSWSKDNVSYLDSPVAITVIITYETGA